MHKSKMFTGIAVLTTAMLMAACAKKEEPVPAVETTPPETTVPETTVPETGPMDSTTGAPGDATAPAPDAATDAPADAAGSTEEDTAQSGGDKVSN